MTFEIDGVLTATYEHNPDPNKEQYLYNVSVFHKTGMDMREHVLKIAAVQGSLPSLLLFDYAVYT